MPPSLHRASPLASFVLGASLLAAAGCGDAAPEVKVVAAGSAATIRPVEGAWPKFRGAGHDGRSTETGIARTWPASGPAVAWRVPLGSGFSGISIADGRLFTLFNRGGDELLAAFDAATGRELWTLKLDGAYRNSFGDGPRSTPTLDGALVYALGAQGKLVAARAATGELVWTRDLVAEFGAQIPEWGASASPIVEGDLLLLDVGGRPGASIVAFDKATGDPRWSVGEDGAGYSSPVPVEAAGVRQVVFLTARKVVGIAPGAGEILWERPWKTDYDVNASTPIFAPPDRLLVTTGYDTGAALFRLEAAGEAIAPVELWRSRELKTKFSSAVRVDEVVFGFDNETLKAIDLATGKDLWQKRGLGHGSLLWADGLLIVLGEKGKLVLLEAHSGEYRELGAFQLFAGKSWTVPTLVDGRLFARDEHELVCLDVAA